MQRHTMTEIVNHSRGTALERSVKTLSRFYVAATLAIGSAMVYTRQLVKFAWRVSNASVQHLRENQTNTEMKQRWGLDSKNNWNAEAKLTVVLQ